MNKNIAIQKDEFDNYYSMAIDTAYTEPFKGRSMGKRNSLFNYAKFKEDNGFHIPTLSASPTYEESHDSTDADSSESRRGSSKCVTSFAGDSKKVQISSALRGNFQGKILSHKIEVSQRLYEMAMVNNVRVSNSLVNTKLTDVCFNYGNQVFGEVPRFSNYKGFSQEQMFLIN
jgi:hypothetical protein